MTERGTEIEIVDLTELDFAPSCNITINKGGEYHACGAEAHWIVFIKGGVPRICGCKTRGNQIPICNKHKDAFMSDVPTKWGCNVCDAIRLEHGRAFVERIEPL